MFNEKVAAIMIQQKLLLAVSAARVSLLILVMSRSQAASGLAAS